MPRVHKTALTVLLLFTAGTVLENIPVQENVEIWAAVNRDGYGRIYGSLTVI